MYALDLEDGRGARAADARGRVLLRRLHAGPRAPAADLHPRGPHRAGTRGRHDARRRPARRRRGAGAGLGRGLLFHAARQPRRQPPVLAVVAPSAHAVGRHRAVGRATSPATARSAPATLVAGGAEESIYQPGWLPDGSLVFASDRDGWWRLYRAAPPFTTVAPVLKTPPPETEFGRPQWILATATWASAGDDQLVVSFTKAGRWHLGAWTLATGTLTPIAPDLQPDEWLAASASEVALVAGHSRAADAVMAAAARRADGPHVEARLGRRTRARRRCPRPKRSSSRRRNGQPAHAFYYPPRNAAAIGAGGRTPTAHRHRPRRTDCGGRSHLRPQDPVLDHARLRGGGRELRRQHGVRARLPAPAERAVGHRGRGRSHQRRALPGGHRTRRRAPPRHPRRQRRRLHGAGRVDPASRGVHAPAPATTASATWKR